MRVRNSGRVRNGGDRGAGVARRVLTVLMAACVVVLVAGCGMFGRGQDGRGHDGGPPHGGMGSRSAPAGAGLPQSDAPADVDPADLTTEIDNEYWPMEPGTQWVYRETDEKGQELRVVVTVTSETKEIADGSTARVVRDTVTRRGEVVEDTFDWYAQDPDGTIWYLGEDTVEFENGKVTTTEGSFEAGLDGALAGVIMPADPAVGMTYRQEFYRGEAEDNGAVLSLDEQAEVPAGHYDDALLTKDTSTIEPDVLEYKLYAPGVGPVLTLGVSGGGGREELVEVGTVSAEVAQAAGTTPLGERYE
ncbi:hypothetical protein [Promicromonospora sp. NPDC059942]|uniref:hypothetical protein n=1 Tax=Promicromonospora sp. NPDC059942 TaxID=3347009 RepID=UPI003663C52B